jgi:hypothetical protein
VKKSIKVARFGEFFFLKSPYLDNRSQQVAKLIAGFLIFFLFSLTHSQIWLIPLVDHCQCGYIIKLRKNNTVWVARTARYSKKKLQFFNLGSQVSTYSKDFDEKISKLSKSQDFYNRFQQVAKNTE